MNDISLRSGDSLVGISANIPTLKTPKIGRHQLLVLGNGFDLECGLPTRFCHFFEPRIEALKAQDWKATGKLEGLGYEATPTLWDFLLRSKVYAPWYSVEDAVNDLVLSAGDGKSEPTGLAEGLIECRRRLAAEGDADVAGPGDGNQPQGGANDASWMSEGQPRSGEEAAGPMSEGQPLTDEGACGQRGEGAALTDEEDLLRNAGEFMAADCSDALRQPQKSWSSQEIVDYLGVQLGKLEDNFSNYMRSVCEGNDEYVERALKLARWMLGDGRPTEENLILSTTILSFNYTNPFKEAVRRSGTVNVINVHGSLDEGIIFGIDGTKCADNPLAFPFSKTYRIMTAGTDFGRGAVRGAGGGLISHETRVVKFYGHSLGEADYAYFQAIFDSVNLYASDTKLVFYYKPHHKPGEDAAGGMLSDKRARNTMAARVTKLLTEYGKTLDNEDHGRNLMHKLMIEGRLEVRLLADE